MRLVSNCIWASSSRALHNFLDLADQQWRSWCSPLPTTQPAQQQSFRVRVRIALTMQRGSSHMKQGCAAGRRNQGRLPRCHRGGGRQSPGDVQQQARPRILSCRFTPCACSADGCLAPKSLIPHFNRVGHHMSRGSREDAIETMRPELAAWPATLVCRAPSLFVRLPSGGAGCDQEGMSVPSLVHAPHFTSPLFEHLSSAPAGQLNHKIHRISHCMAEVACAFANMA